MKENSDKSKLVIRSLSPDTYPYFPEWTEVTPFLATGLVGPYEKKWVPIDWVGPEEHPVPNWEELLSGEQDRARFQAGALVAAMYEELETSDLNVCHTADLAEETRITAVALAIRAVKRLRPEHKDRLNEWAAVMRELELMQEYEDEQDNN